MELRQCVAHCACVQRSAQLRASLMLITPLPSKSAAAGAGGTFWPISFMIIWMSTESICPLLSTSQSRKFALVQVTATDAVAVWVPALQVIVYVTTPAVLSDTGRLPLTASAAPVQPSPALPPVAAHEVEFADVQVSVTDVPTVAVALFDTSVAVGCRTPVARCRTRSAYALPSQGKAQL